MMIYGNLLVGIYLLVFPEKRELIIDVYGKQDKLVKKGKQEVMNNESRERVRARLNMGGHS
jgi:hypothetical protein